MEKVAFSQVGFKQLESQLYELNDSDLQIEANAVLVNYIGWVADHFDLDTSQIMYLQSLDSIFIATLAAKAATAFINRLPLNLVLPHNYSSKADEKRGKWFLDASTIVVSATPGQPVNASGELIYEFEYVEEEDH